MLNRVTITGDLCLLLERMCHFQRMRDYYCDTNVELDWVAWPISFWLWLYILVISYNRLTLTGNDFGAWWKIVICVNSCAIHGQVG